MSEGEKWWIREEKCRDGRDVRGGQGEGQGVLQGGQGGGKGHR